MGYVVLIGVLLYVIENPYCKTWLDTTASKNTSEHDKNTVSHFIILTGIVLVDVCT